MTTSSIPRSVIFILVVHEHNIAAIEATPAAQDAWVAHVNEVANFTLFPQANSWYMGRNIPGKPHVFMPYIGGLNLYIPKMRRSRQQQLRRLHPHAPARHDASTPNLRPRPVGTARPCPRVGRNRT
jgi:hypothetical protein